MAQDPVQVDQLQIEPGAAGTRLINRAADGSLQFTDAILTGGITLFQMAGLKSMANALIVGKSGAGAGYTTIQSALDAIPASSSITNPYFVFVGPGVYKETVNIVRDGVFIFGYGATLKSLAEDTPDGAGAYHTLVIQAALGTIPRNVTIVGLPIYNAHSSFAAVRIVGGAGSQVGSGGITLQDCPLSAVNRPIWATSVDYICVRGGNMAGSNTLALVYALNCAKFIMDSVDDVPNVQLDYDTTEDIPSVVTSAYRLNGCGNLGWGGLSPNITSTLDGAGELDIVGCSGGAIASFLGTQSVNVLGSDVGAVTVGGSVALSFTGSSRGTLTAGGTATVAEPFQQGVIVFVAATTATVVFPAPQPDTNYSVNVEVDSVPVSNDQWWVTTKTAAGFVINYAHNQTLNATWTAQRVM